jgi:predicted transposase YbfD/YdcC
LSALPLAGRIITGDALYMQHACCDQIIEAGAEYLFIVKGNQPTLQAEIACLFAEPKACARSTFAQEGDSHGDRTEVRQLWASAELGRYLQTELGWTGAEQACKIRRQVLSKKGALQEERYALTSLSPQRADATRLLTLVRGHWGIENRLHYVRDVTLGEDANQTRTGAAPQVLAALRNAVLNLLRASGQQNIAAAIRSFGWQSNAALVFLGRGP